MSLKNLIKNQVIMIDDHKRGSREVKNWDDPALDVHIDKKTNFPVEGKMQSVRIRLPLNSEREIKITTDKNDNRLESIPNSLRKEIKSALKDRKTRDSFVKSIMSVIEGFDSVLDNKEKATRAVKKIAKHFDLGWPIDQIEERVAGFSETLTKYTEVYENPTGDSFFVSIDKQQIQVGQNNGAAYDEKLQNKKH